MAAKFSHQLILFANTDSPIQLELRALKKAEIVIRTLYHPIRLMLVRLLLEKEEMKVTEMYVHLRLPQSVVSQHLARLRRAKVVVTRRQGKFIFYSISQQRIVEVYEAAKTIVANT